MEQGDSVHLLRRANRQPNQATTSTQDLAVGLYLLHDQDFPAGSLNSVVWSAAERNTQAAGQRWARGHRPAGRCTSTSHRRDTTAGSSTTESPSTSYQRETSTASDSTKPPTDQRCRPRSGQHQALRRGPPPPAVPNRLAGHRPASHASASRPHRRQPEGRVRRLLCSKKFKELINDRKGTDVSHNPPLNKI